MSNTNKFVAERFQAIIEHYGISTPAFSKELGFERADKIYNIVNGKFNPSYDILLAITNKFVDVNIDWLISGRGKMLLDDDATNLNSTADDSELREYIINKLCNLIEENLLLKQEVEIFKKCSPKPYRADSDTPAIAAEPKLKGYDKK